MNVIGLDLSLTAPGMAAPGRLPETLHTDPKRGDRRFCDIRDWLIYNVEPYRGRRVDLAVIEAVPPYATSTVRLEHVHAIAREVLARYDIPYAYVNVTALKAFATGDGRADKSEVMVFVAEQTGRAPEDDNMADAWVLKRMGEVLHPLTLTQAGVYAPALQAMSAVGWPLKPNDPGWPQPYGPILRKPVTKKCRHGIVCLKNGDGWLHPFNVVACDKPPK